MTKAISLRYVYDTTKTQKKVALTALRCATWFVTGNRKHPPWGRELLHGKGTDTTRPYTDGAILRNQSKGVRVWRGLQNL